MSTIVATPAHLEQPQLPPVDLVESDGENLETFWHQVQIILLADVINFRFEGRQDFFVGGNMFIYFNVEQARNRDFRGPDFFFVDGVNRFPIRRWWAVWDEGGRYPDMILELLSPSTAREDRTVKKDVYEAIFRTPEYFCYDPDEKKLEGWMLSEGRYHPLKANEQGRLWSAKLEAWLGVWEGTYLGLPATWLRFFDKDGQVLPTCAEAAATRAEAIEAEVRQLQAKLAETKGKSPE